MALKPWYTIISPRKDLREGKPLDASEFAVHLGDVKEGTAPDDYSKPSRFFERTYLTKNLLDLSSQAMRRLSGITTETSPVFNLTTQFGGGKTHSLALLYHLAENGQKAKSWQGVDKILNKAGISDIPKARTAVFVGTEFDSLTGRGGKDGTPLRKTPWGEIAYQLNGNKGFDVVEEHDRKQQAPAGDVIKKIFQDDKPCLILMDELMNYSSRNRKTGLNTQLYDFIQNLSETVRGLKNVVLVISIPASELEMTSEDHEDYERFKKMLDRLSKPMFMAAEKETSEIIRRRLFEWHGLTTDARKSITEYVDWLQEFKSQIPSWFNIDNSREEFEACYPFHPSVLSLFERKWQQLPRFQKTRGILRLLALWVSKCYNDGYKNSLKQPLIDLGSAPLDDPIFRSALFEQLGDTNLEGAVTTDISGKTDSHSIRLDNEAIDSIKKYNLHKKSSSIIFFESNGGQSANTFATIPEIKLDIGGPDIDIGLIDQVIQDLIDNCYYLNVEKNKYKFSTKENLIKRFSDRRASIKGFDIIECMQEEIKKVFDKSNGIEKILFPEKSNQITDRPVISIIILKPEQNLKEKKDTLKWIDEIVKNNGQSARVYKNGLIFAVADSDIQLKDEARKYLAWEDISDEADGLHFDDNQIRTVNENVKKAKRDLNEQVWRSYKNLVLLDKDNTLHIVDLGLIHSSSAKSIIELYINRLTQNGEITDIVSHNYLIRNWPPAFIEWSTKNMRDTFYASPQLPKLLVSETLKETISKGVSNGLLAYVGKKDGKYNPFYFEKSISSSDIEFSDDMFIIKKEEAKKHIEPRKLTKLQINPNEVNIEFGKSFSFTAKGIDQHTDEIKIGNVKWEATGGNIDSKGVYKAGKDEGTFIVKAIIGDIISQAKIYISEKVKPMVTEVKEDSKNKKISWTGNIPWQKWSVFYTKVLTNFSSRKNLKITVSFEVEDENISSQKIEEAKSALKELDLNDEMKID